MDRAFLFKNLGKDFVRRDKLKWESGRVLPSTVRWEPCRDRLAHPSLSRERKAVFMYD